MAGLTAKQQAFVDEYLVDLNATQAAIRAGYSPKNADVTGPRLLGNVGIAEAIKTRMDERADRLGVTQDDVVQALRAIAFADLREVTEWGREQDESSGLWRVYVRLRDSERLSDEAAVALNELRVDASGHLTVRLSDKLRALELLGRHLGMFKRDVDVRVSGGFTVEHLHELAEAFGDSED